MTRKKKNPIGKTAVRRIVHRAGITLMSADMHGELNRIAREHLEGVLHVASVYALASRRRTISMRLARLALERKNRTLLGV